MFSSLFGLELLEKVKGFLSNLNQSNHSNEINSKIEQSKLKLKKHMPIAFEEEFNKIKNKIEVHFKDCNY